MAKHEGNRDFSPVTPDSPSYKACCVVEIKPERMTAKSDLSQNRTPDQKRAVAEHLAKRGLPGDLEAVRAMGFELEGNEKKGWRLKG